MRWVVQIARMVGMTNIYKILDGNSEGRVLMGHYIVKK
jgi:hypothetical protein